MTRDDKIEYIKSSVIDGYTLPCDITDCSIDYLFGKVWEFYNYSN